MFKKTIDVFWTGIGPKQHSLGPVTFEPDSALKDLAERVQMMDNYNPHLSTDLKKCPAVTNYLKNTFRIRSPFDYNIRWGGSQSDPAFASTMRDQKFFEDCVCVRDGATGFLSFRFAQMCFVTEEPSLVIEQKHAGYSVSDFTKNVSVLEGAFDIGKWIRTLDLTFFINHPNYLVDIKRGDTLYYIKFHTQHKVNLRKFHLTPEFEDIVDQIVLTQRSSNHKNIGINKMEKYYNFLKQSKYKKYILKLVKQNVLE